MDLDPKRLTRLLEVIAFCTDFRARGGSAPGGGWVHTDSAKHGIYMHPEPKAPSSFIVTDKAQIPKTSGYHLKIHIPVQRGVMGVTVMMVKKRKKEKKKKLCLFRLINEDYYLFIFFFFFFYFFLFFFS